MKKILYFFSLLAMAVMTLSSCRDDSKANLPVFEEASIVMFESIESPIIDYPNIATSKFRAILGDRNSNVAKYELNVSLYSNGQSTDTVYLKSVESFPSSLEISAAEVAQVLGMSVSDFIPGDRFDLIATITSRSGKVVTPAEMGDDLTNPGQRQALFFSVYLSCAFDPDEIGGTYDVVNDDFEVVLDTEVTVVAGPGANQYTIQDVFGHGLDLIVDVDPVTGESISDRQQTWVPQNFGLPAAFGKGYAEVKSGFSFSCSGTLTFNFEYSVDIGTYGDGFNMTFQRR